MRARLKLTQGALKNIHFPVPSLPEQHRIVEKIEALFSELDQGVAALETTRQQLKVYRQAVLKHAFEGKLTEQWRSDTREQAFERVMLGSLFGSSPQNGIYKPKSEYGSGVPIFRIDDFYDGKIVNRPEYKQLRLSKTESEKYRVHSGDILVNRVNSIEYLGKCGLVPDHLMGFVFESNIMKIRLAPEVSTPYVVAYLSSRTGRNELTKNAKHAVNQASINQKDVAAALVPLCSLEEQHQIVQEIEARLSVIDDLEKTIDENLQKAQGLRQSILKKAFAGELVPTEDEPD